MALTFRKTRYFVHERSFYQRVARDIQEGGWIVDSRPYTIAGAPAVCYLLCVSSSRAKCGSSEITIEKEDEIVDSSSPGYIIPYHFFHAAQRRNSRGIHVCFGKCYQDILTECLTTQIYPMVLIKLVPIGYLARIRWCYRVLIIKKVLIAISHDWTDNRHLDNR